MKKIIKTAGIIVLCCLMLSLSGCTKITSVPKEEFIRVVAEELGIDEAEIIKDTRVEEIGEIISFEDPVSEVVITYEPLEHPNDATLYIQTWNEHVLGNIGFAGKRKSFWLGSSAYSLFSGRSETVKEEYGIEDDCVVYGGLYAAEGYAYRIMTIRGDSKETVDRILDRLGFPKP